MLDAVLVYNLEYVRQSAGRYHQVLQKAQMQHESPRRNSRRF